MLKESQYNVYSKTKEGYVVYNTLYGSFAELDKDEYSYIKNFSWYSLKSEDMILLQKNGFLIDSAIDEFEVYNRIRKGIMDVQKNSENSYIIAVTSECNARCYYCFEKGVKPSVMSAEVAVQVAEFIEKNAGDRKFSRINWFGGEPLLNREIISYISSLLIDRNVCFASSLITNGLLFSESIIAETKKQWKLTYVQITLDGIWENYNRAKNYITDFANPFQTVVENIFLLVKNEISVIIRLNICKSNYKEILKVIKYLDEKMPFSPFLYFYPAFLVGIDENEVFDEKEKINVIVQILDILPYYSLMSHRSILYEIPRLYACMRESKNDILLDTDGSVCRCERHVGRGKHSSIFTEPCIQNFAVDYTYDKKCESCVYFPRCLGGCMEDRIAGRNFCSINKYIIQAMVERGGTTRYFYFQ